MSLGVSAGVAAVGDVWHGDVGRGAPRTARLCRARCRGRLSIRKGPRPRAARRQPLTLHKRISGRRWQRIVRYIVARDQGICWICGLPGATSADHILAIADGGHATHPGNLAAAHLYCNLSRAAHGTNSIRRHRSMLRHYPWLDDEPPPRPQPSIR